MVPLVVSTTNELGDDGGKGRLGTSAAETEGERVWEGVKVVEALPEDGLVLALVSEVDDGDLVPEFVPEGEAVIVPEAVGVVVTNGVLDGVAVADGDVDIVAVGDGEAVLPHASTDSILDHP